MSIQYSLTEIVEHLGGYLSEEATLNEVMISRVASLASGQSGSIGFFNDTKYTDQLKKTVVSAVILRPQHQPLTKLPSIISDNPYAYFAKLSKLLNPSFEYVPGNHPSAVIAETAVIPKSCSIAAQVSIGEGVVLGEHVVIEPGCVIERDVYIGDYTRLEPNVTIKHHTKIGKYCTLYSGVVIGAEGFGYAEDVDSEQNKRWVKIPQIGRVVIGNYVDVGANTTIDRGALDDTVIEDGVKIDNLVQIAHNCRIGAHTVIAACAGIAGSAVIGKHCKIAGAAMISGHISIADNVTISPGTMISRSITQAGVYTGLMPFQPHSEWLRTAVNVRNLNEITSKIKDLEKPS